MAWTRAGQIGFEHNSSLEYSLLGGSAISNSLSTTKAKTGTYSMRETANAGGLGLSFASTTQIRAGVWLNHNAPNNASAQPWYLFWTGAGGNDAFRWDNSANVLDLRINGVSADSVAETTGGADDTDTWRHYAVVVYANATTGWVSAYLDGTKILEVTGVNTGTGITYAGFGWYSGAAGGWASYAYYDDFYVDVGSGSEPDVAPPQKQFGFRTVNGAGTHAAWTPSAGSNYQNVDDAGAHDGDTTYNSATSSGLQDSYATSSYSLPADTVLVAEIPSVIAKRTSSTEELKIGLTDDTNDSLSSAKTLTTAYALYQERLTTQPDGSAWNEADGNATDLLIESAGTY